MHIRSHRWQACANAFKCRAGRLWQQCACTCANILRTALQLLHANLHLSSRSSQTEHRSYRRAPWEGVTILTLHCLCNFWQPQMQSHHEGGLLSEPCQTCNLMRWMQRHCCVHLPFAFFTSTSLTGYKVPAAILIGHPLSKHHTAFKVSVYQAVLVAASYRDRAGRDASWGCPEGGHPVLGSEAGNVVQANRACTTLQSQAGAWVTDAPVAKALKPDPPTALLCRQLVRHQSLADDCCKPWALLARLRPAPRHRQDQLLDA